MVNMQKEVANWGVPDGREYKLACLECELIWTEYTPKCPSTCPRGHSDITIARKPKR